MKKIIAIIMTVVVCCFTIIGCKSIPTPEKAQLTSYAVGYATANIVNETKISNNARNTIVDVLSKVETIIPEVDQSFQDAWMPYVTNIVNSSSLPEFEKILVVDVCNLVIKSVDYIVTVREPKAKQYKDLTAAVVHGFCSGFLTHFTPVNTFRASNEIQPDAEAYIYLKSIKNF